MKIEYNKLIYLGCCVFIFFLIYLLFKINLKSREGMTDASGNEIEDGIAGNASSFSAGIKVANIKLQDMFLVNKYRADYEGVIINLDDYINNLMLQSVLTIDQNKPQESLKKLAELNQAKLALNNVMKFIDNST